ncbi:MAG: hypothetical protein CVT92_03495, partial [Bacteroidetes bacterium HGW-Bacteroidetes-1]
MHIEQHKWYSPSMYRDMELKIYGHFGKPLIIFPTQGGSFHEAEDYQMIDVLRRFINEGRIKVFTVDSIDNDAWANEGAAVHDRGNRYEQYNRYIMNEVVPFIRNHCNDHEIKIALNGSPSKNLLYFPFKCVIIPIKLANTSIVSSAF